MPKSSIFPEHRNVTLGWLSKLLANQQIQEQKFKNRYKHVAGKGQAEFQVDGCCTHTCMCVCLCVCPHPLWRHNAAVTFSDGIDNSSLTP